MHLIKSVVFKLDSNEWVIIFFFDVNNDRGHSKKKSATVYVNIIPSNSIF